MKTKNAKARRCKECSRIINLNNKSGLCTYHYGKQYEKDKRMKKCNICEEPCSGKLLIEIRKGSLTSFCTSCFDKVNQIPDIRGIKKMIKYLKSNHY